MKVTRNTPDQLIIENNPVLLAVLITLFALVFVGIGIFLLKVEFWMGVAFISAGIITGVVFNLVFTRRTMFVFDRPGNLVEMRRKSLLGFSKRTWELQHMSNAVIETSHSDDGTTYRAALVFTGGMDAGTHPVTLVYSSGNGAERAKDAINTWLAAR